MVAAKNKNQNRESSYPHYSTILNLTDIVFPMMLNQIKKFENLNNISINVYSIENKKEIFPLRLIQRETSTSIYCTCKICAAMIRFPPTFRRSRCVYMREDT